MMFFLTLSPSLSQLVLQLISNDSPQGENFPSQFSLNCGNTKIAKEKSGKIVKSSAFEEDENGANAQRDST